MSALPLPDMQTLAALAIGLFAAVHVLRCWAPSWRRLWGSGAPAKASASGCGTGASTSGAGCGSGCGQCGSATSTPHKDHRVHIVRRANH